MGEQGASVSLLEAWQVCTLAVFISGIVSTVQFVFSPLLGIVLMSSLNCLMAPGSFLSGFS